MTCEKLYLDSLTKLPSKHFIVKQKKGFDFTDVTQGTIIPA
jgi:hypothetical protein